MSLPCRKFFVCLAVLKTRRKIKHKQELLPTNFLNVSLDSLSLLYAIQGQLVMYKCHHSTKQECIRTGD